MTNPFAPLNLPLPPDDNEQSPIRRSPNRTRVLLAAAVVVVAGGTVAIGYAVSSPGGDPRPTAESHRVATETDKPTPASGVTTTTPGTSAPGTSAPGTSATTTAPATTTTPLTTAPTTQTTTLLTLPGVPGLPAIPVGAPDGDPHLPDTSANRALQAFFGPRISGTCDSLPAGDSTIITCQTSEGVVASFSQWSSPAQAESMIRRDSQPRSPGTWKTQVSTGGLYGADTAGLPGEYCDEWSYNGQPFTAMLCGSKPIVEFLMPIYRF